MANFLQKVSHIDLNRGVSHYRILPISRDIEGQSSNWTTSGIKQHILTVDLTL